MWNLFQYRSYITLKKGSNFLPKYEEIPTESFSISWTWNEALSAFKITHIFVTEFSLFFRIIPPEQRRTNLILYRHSEIGPFHWQQITNSNFHFLILF